MGGGMGAGMGAGMMGAGMMDAAGLGGPMGAGMMGGVLQQYLDPATGQVYGVGIDGQMVPTTAGASAAVAPTGGAPSSAGEGEVAELRLRCAALEQQMASIHTQVLPQVMQCSAAMQQLQMMVTQMQSQMISTLGGSMSGVPPALNGGAAAGAAVGGAGLGGFAAGLLAVGAAAGAATEVPSAAAADGAPSSVGGKRKAEEAYAEEAKRQA
mmetsp:Transcript_55688/g.146144  ORF Transcript_55688/g.146144 Transcript_55688/m.146144 type:complete len:211 (+) Transcript_55688:1-633(+)